MCSTENKAHDILPRLTITAGALALMFGFGSLWTGSGRAQSGSTDNAVGIESPALPPTAARQPTGSASETSLEVPTAPNVQTTEQTQTAATLSAAGDKNTDKYFCGALTKKGTPCSRKVKGKGLRCFQHEGKPGAPTSE